MHPVEAEAGSVDGCVWAGHWQPVLAGAHALHSQPAPCTDLCDTARKRGTHRVWAENKKQIFFCFRAGVKIPALFSSHVSCPNTCAGRTIPYLREPCGFFILWFHSAHFSHFIFLCKASPQLPTHWPWPTQGVCKHYMGIYEQSCCSGGAGGLLLLHLRALVTFRVSYSPPNNSYYFKWTWAQTQQFNPQTSCWN